MLRGGGGPKREKLCSRPTNRREVSRARYQHRSDRPVVPRVPALARRPDLGLRLLHASGALGPRGRQRPAARGRGTGPAVRARLAPGRSAARHLPARQPAAPPRDGRIAGDPRGAGGPRHGRTNDMVVDDQGRAFVGNFGFDLMAGAPVAPTVLLRVDPDGTVAQVADDMWFPNGSVITDDGVLLVDETFGNRVTAFDIAHDGSLTNRRTWASFGDLPTTATSRRPSVSSRSPRTGAGSTPRARCGSPTRSAAASCGCARAARCWRTAGRLRRLRLHARRPGRPDAVPVQRARLRPHRTERRARGESALRPGRRAARRSPLVAMRSRL